MTDQFYVCMYVCMYGQKINDKVIIVSAVMINVFVIAHVIIYAKQKHLGCKTVRGQSEATLQTGMCDQKL